VKPHFAPKIYLEPSSLENSPYSYIKTNEEINQNFKVSIFKTLEKTKTPLPLKKKLKSS
jgi:hypothetical protein